VTGRDVHVISGSATGCVDGQPPLGYAMWLLWFGRVEIDAVPALRRRRRAPRSCCRRRTSSERCRDWRPLPGRRRRCTRSRRTPLHTGAFAAELPGDHAQSLRASAAPTRERRRCSRSCSRSRPSTGADRSSVLGVDHRRRPVRGAV
jgi:hypothetical protein